MKIHDSWQKNQAAGKQWYYDFMWRNNKLSLTKPEATSLSWATGFNRCNVSLSFKNLSGILEKHRFTPDKIYNLDETANTTVHTPDKIVACKGIKQVGERGPNVTFIACINALGNSIPSMFIIPHFILKNLC
jgi:hypothetical protein